MLPYYLYFFAFFIFGVNMDVQGTTLVHKFQIFHIQTDVDFLFREEK